MSSNDVHIICCEGLPTTVASDIFITNVEGGKGDILIMNNIENVIVSISVRYKPKGYEVPESIRSKYPLCASLFWKVNDLGYPAHSIDKIKEAEDPMKYYHELLENEITCAITDKAHILKRTVTFDVPLISREDLEENIGAYEKNVEETKSKKKRKLKV
jgi:hypothetical protein